MPHGRTKCYECLRVVKQCRCIAGSHPVVTRWTTCPECKIVAGAEHPPAPVSSQPMEWKTTRRETGLIEHICSHGVGHANHGSALWLSEEYAHETEGRQSYDTWMIHGCDGCCDRDDFPGTWRGSLEHAHEIIRAQKTSQALHERQLRFAREHTDSMRARAAMLTEQLDRSTKLVAALCENTGITLCQCYNPVPVPCTECGAGV